MRKSIIHHKTPSQMIKMFIKYSQKKTRIKIVGSSMVNSIEVRWMNKTNQFHIKVRRYSEASSIHIINLEKCMIKSSSMRTQTT